MTARDWQYYDGAQGQWVGPASLEDLDELNRTGVIDETTEVISQRMIRLRGPKARAIPYGSLSRPKVEFSPNLEEFFAARSDRFATILSGPNNCGKTLALKNLFSLTGYGGYLVGCNRFSHVDFLNTRALDQLEHRRYFDNFADSFYTTSQNTENNDRNLEQVLTGLKDSARDKLFSISRDLLGNTFSLKRTDPENTFSPFYVDMDGENLRFGSTGTRLVLTLLGILLDDRFSTILLDEPEIGLSPRIQSRLARFLYDEKRREEFCPHIRQLYIATHSHLFLDKRDTSNNHLVSKSGNRVTIKKLDSIAAFHELQFSMLGNSLEALFLPAAILIVEGASDVVFLSKVFGLHLATHQIAIVRAGGDGEVQNKLNILKEAFGDMSKSPYRARTFVVLDKVHTLDKRRLENQGLAAEQVFVWSENGIEHLYPVELVAEAFMVAPADVAVANIESDPIELNGIRKTKKELAAFVAEKLSLEHQLKEELAAVVRRVRESCI